MKKTRFTAQLSRTVNNEQRTLEIPAYTTDTPGLVVNKWLTPETADHQTPGRWVVTHRTSGMTISGRKPFTSRRQAIAAANAVSQIADWAQPEGVIRQAIESDARDQMRRIFDAIRSGEKLGR